jgi:uncharacterized protein
MRCGCEPNCKIARIIYIVIMKENLVNIKKIAVVGSGISGLSAAWLLSQIHDVSLIEAGSYVGGHSNTVDCASATGKIAVDTGFIVYNEKTYPNLTAMFDYLDVDTADASMGFGVSLEGGSHEYSGASIAHLIGHTRNLLRPKHWGMIFELVRFFKTAALHISAVSETTSLRQFLQSQGYGQNFLDLHLLPVAAAIWSCEPAQMLDYPAAAFLRFFENHGLLNLIDRPQWRSVVGGSRSYVQKLLVDAPMRVVLNCPISNIKRAKAGVQVFGENGFSEQFDDVVLATHANTSLKILEHPTFQENQMLSAFQYSTNQVVLHTDQSFMPRRKHLWSSWNYVSDRKAEMGNASVTYWMNRLQPLATAENIFVTLNAKQLPSVENIKTQFTYQHPIFTPQTRAAQHDLWSLQGQNNTWFCGAYFGAGFHEDGLQAGLAVAEQLGGVKRPWKVNDESGRIFIGDKTRDDISHLMVAAE